MGYPLGEPFFSVCGWLCGQTQIQKSKSAGKVLKYKKNPAFPTGKTGLSGAAGRIRTADLILTNSLRTSRSLIYKPFWAFLPRKDEASRPLFSVVSARSFPRVGHGVGQASLALGRLAYLSSPTFSFLPFFVTASMEGVDRWWLLFFAPCFHLFSML